MNQPKNHRQEILEQLRSMSHLLDNAIAIPGTSYRIGLDPIMGLLPAVGDYLGAIFSSYIIFKAAQMGVSNATLSRMALNVILEALVGTVPIAGDLFDANWKANLKNMELLEAHLDTPQRRKRTDWSFIGFLLGGLMVAIFLIAILSMAILRSLFLLIRG